MPRLALLPNGHVLCVVGAVVTSGVDAGWAGFPISFFEFDGSALNPVTPPSNAPNTLTFNCRSLLLPTGQVLYSNCTSDLQVFTPTGSPHSHWRPHISHVPKTLRRGHSYCPTPSRLVTTNRRYHEWNSVKARRGSRKALTARCPNCPRRRFAPGAVLVFMLPRTSRG